jgi:hypothetical protein
MKTHQYWLLSLIALMVGITSRSQQGEKKLELNYTAGIPTGNLKNLTDQVSWRGMEGAFLYGVTDQISVGLETGFQDFYQKFPRKVFSESGADLSAVITNSIQVLPIMVKGRYRFSPAGAVEPYVSLAAGGNMISYEKYYGQFVDEKTSFGFAAQPELGLRIPVGASKRSGFHLAAAYNFMPFRYNDADGLSHAVLKAGFSFGLNE